MTPEEAVEVINKILDVDSNFNVSIKPPIEVWDDSHKFIYHLGVGIKAYSKGIKAWDKVSTHQNTHTIKTPNSEMHNESLLAFVVEEIKSNR